MSDKIIGWGRYTVLVPLYEQEPIPGVIREIAAYVPTYKDRQDGIIVISDTMTLDQKARFDAEREAERLAFSRKGKD